MDPRLNSVHLEAPRRQQYRRAREAVLYARGNHTLAAEGLAERLPTAVDSDVPASVQLWLADRGHVYPLHVGLNTVGRSRDNDVVLADGYVSRRHCAIVVHSNQRVEVFDTASKNGTFVNGSRLQASARLKCGDEIRMCESQLVFMARGQHESDAGPNSVTLADP